MFDCSLIAANFVAYFYPVVTVFGFNKLVSVVNCKQDQLCWSSTTIITTSCVFLSYTLASLS